MKAFILIVTLSFLFVSCKQKEMTLEDLQKAKWTNLAQGIDYISTRKASKAISEKDSFILKLKGFNEGEAESIEDSISKEDFAMPDIFSNILKEHLTKSKAGYLKINLTELFKSSFFTGQVYLRGDYTEPFSFSKDSAILITIPGIVSASFISKEEAKKEYQYLLDENSDWSKVLDENPLPNAIEVKLENKNWTKESLEELKSSITEKLIMASDFSYPGLLFEKSNIWYFFEYKRITISYPQ